MAGDILLFLALHRQVFPARSILGRGVADPVGANNEQIRTRPAAASSNFFNAMLACTVFFSLLVGGSWSPLPCIKGSPELKKRNCVRVVILVRLDSRLLLFSISNYNLCCEKISLWLLLLLLLL